MSLNVDKLTDNVYNYHIDTCRHFLLTDKGGKNQ